MSHFGLKRIIVLAVAGLIALVGAETFTRALLPQNRDTVLDILVPDETVGYIYEANVTADERGRDYDVKYITNSLGLRDREYEIESPDVLRVLLVGNSFCVSHGLEIEESLSRVLERAFSSSPADENVNRTIEVINTSNAGYSAYNYWRSYARWAPLFGPDVVIVGFVSSREHRCDAEGTRFLIQDGLLRARYQGTTPPSLPQRKASLTLRKALARNSDLYVLMRNFFYYNDRVGRFLGDRGDQGEVLRMLAPYRLDPQQPVLDGRKRAFRYLDKLRNETSRDGVGLLVLGIPQKPEVVDASWEATRALAMERGMSIERSIPAQALIAHCDSSGIAVIDLTPTLARVGASGFFEHDNHWNRVGVAASAKAIAEALGAQLRAQ